MRKIQRQIVSALVISKDQKLLMGMKDSSKGGVYSDCWHIPGGGVEEGEDQVKALQREIMEEVGIDISACKVEIVDDKGSGVSVKKLKDGEEVECQMQFFVYRVDINKNAHDISVQLDDDLVKYEWASLNDLRNYKLTPPSISLFQRLKWL
jgi:8-oxo-dGTP pyrophosphatase MutT (NUDIX family)